MNSSEVSTNRQNLTFGEYLVLAGVGTVDKDVPGLVSELPKPFECCGVRVPDSLDDLNFGQLTQLQGMKQEVDLFFEPCRAILGVVDEAILSERAIVIIAFAAWVSKEVTRINNLFATTRVPPTAEELNAGIDTLDFGPFGLVDYFAMRMGMTDHEQVMSIPWVRIYQCLKIDADKAKYERRLRKVYEDKKTV